MKAKVQVNADTGADLKKVLGLIQTANERVKEADPKNAKLLALLKDAAERLEKMSNSSGDDN